MRLTKTRRRARVGSLAAIFAAFALSAGALAAGGDDTDAGTSAKDQPKLDLTTCERGKVWGVKDHKCLPQQSGVLPDDDLANYAFALAKSERYEDAIAVLDLMQKPDTSKALNYRGYATRKLGRTDEGVGYYLKSLALDPNYVQAREYLGEAYVIQGKLDLAKEQLSKIKTICGANACDEYSDLEKALKGAHAL
jgi:tetratricopeptide (TPR) repeat protein